MQENGMPVQSSQQSGGKGDCQKAHRGNGTPQQGKSAGVAMEASTWRRFIEKAKGKSNPKEK
jgi:hypothetical protein